jgi:Ni,Fe-hydrogenase I cytochrome b subunit
MNMAEQKVQKSTEGLSNQDTMQLVWFLVGGGALSSIYLLIKRNYNFFSWLIPVGMIASGFGLYMNQRQKLITQTGDEIISQLDELDPIARAEVVKYMADQEIGRLSG